MEKHIEEAYELEEGDKVRLVTNEDFELEGEVVTSETSYPGDEETTAKVNRFEIKSVDDGMYWYVVNMSPSVSYSQLMEEGRVTKENHDEKTYGYIEELEHLD